MREDISIRPYRVEDRQQVRELFRDGAQRGNPLKVYIDDEELVLKVLVDYYIDYEPQWCLVAEAENRVVGYVLATDDTRRYTRILATRILPRLALRVVWNTFACRYIGTKTFKVIWWFLARSWRELPEVSLDAYPIHVHLIIDRDFRGLQVGKMLLAESVRMFREEGYPGGHAIIMEEAGRDTFAKAFGLQVKGVKKSTLWSHCSDKDWQFKIVVVNL